jgi:hypothetical protein
MSATKEALAVVAAIIKWRSSLALLTSPGTL